MSTLPELLRHYLECRAAWDQARAISRANLQTIAAPRHTRTPLSENRRAWLEHIRESWPRPCPELPGFDEFKAYLNATGRLESARFALECAVRLAGGGPFLIDGRRVEWVRGPEHAFLAVQDPLPGDAAAGLAISIDSTLTIAPRSQETPP
jgi:hypothetical protein